MKTFKEYILDEKFVGEQAIYMPHGAIVVNVSESNKGLILLAIATPEACTVDLPEIRTFKICATDEIFYANTVKYIGSFKSELGIKHVIEIIKEY